MSEFRERILELGHAKQPFVFSHPLKTNSLALFRVQARGKEEGHVLGHFGVVVVSVMLRCVERRDNDPGHIDKLEFPPFVDSSHERIAFLLSGSNLCLGSW